MILSPETKEKQPVTWLARMAQSLAYLLCFKRVVSSGEPCS
ncbi:hypothetical protein RBSWK_04396 [Rhodopirellula baltica SWK14]|uniref:Uncharacterized protein n=1 Tax=Rhodopirellula baltica SWK14 TaxID=993516 RepID=L7CDG7_RHOBT|nr:hypothetical protein RBSWK_04396 [Rhodopirellula baltica SWK14]